MNPSTPPTRVHYRKLTRSRGGLLGRVSLWIGPGHLMLVEQNSFQESYKRYDFEDIQAVISWDTKRRTAFRALVPLLLGFPSFAILGTLADSWLIAALAWIPVGVLLVINELRGPTVKAVLITAVQTVELSCLRRRSEYDKLIQELATVIPPLGSEAGPALESAELPDSSIAARHPEISPPLPTARTTLKITPGGQSQVTSEPVENG